MNKHELVDAVGERLGDRRTAATAVDAVLQTVTSALREGERVSLFGFGVFERVERAARTARNPATGGTVQVPATAVPRFRPGQALKDAVRGSAPAAARTAPAPAGPLAEERPAKGTRKGGPKAEGKAPKDKAPKDKAPKDKAPKDKAAKDKGGKGKKAGKGKKG